MSKYQPLQEYLLNSNANTLSLSFSDIEKILGFKLPASSLKHRAWWSNNPSNNVMTEAWIKAGYETGEVDLESKTLKFNLQKMKNLVAQKLKLPPEASNENQIPKRSPLFGALKGQMIVFPGIDLTEPLWPEPEDDYDVLA